jgi:hypothetical protein
MAAKNILKNDSFKSTIRYKAVCVKKDLKSSWRATEKEAVLDALDHQNTNPQHVVEILVEQTQTFTAKIGADKIKMYK